VIQNSSLKHHTLYQASDLSECVKVLHGLCCKGTNSNLPAIREKYSQHKVCRTALSTSTPQILNQLAQPLLSTSVLQLSIFVCLSGLHQFSEFLEECFNEMKIKSFCDMVCHDCIEQECIFTWHTVLSEDV
jgi:hypothetical protein